MLCSRPHSREALGGHHKALWLWYAHKVLGRSAQNFFMHTQRLYGPGPLPLPPPLRRGAPAAFGPASLPPGFFARAFLRWGPRPSFVSHSLPPQSPRQALRLLRAPLRGVALALSVPAVVPCVDRRAPPACPLRGFGAGRLRPGGVGSRFAPPGLFLLAEFPLRYPYLGRAPCLGLSRVGSFSPKPLSRFPAPAGGQGKPEAGLEVCASVPAAVLPSGLLWGALSCPAVSHCTGAVKTKASAASGRRS